MRDLHLMKLTIGLVLYTCALYVRLTPVLMSIIDGNGEPP